MQSAILLDSLVTENLRRPCVLSTWREGGQACRCSSRCWCRSGPEWPPFARHILLTKDIAEISYKMRFSIHFIAKHDVKNLCAKNLLKKFKNIPGPVLT